MNDYWLYLRLLTELHAVHSDRSIGATRAHLQDVLQELHGRVCRERGDTGDGQEIQDQAEYEASREVRA